jgi:general secretion pathway protein G
MWIINKNKTFKEIRPACVFVCNRKGFTLVEMLVVMVIIGLLAGLIGPRLFTRVDDSKVRTAKVQIKMIKGALETLRMDIGRFPTEEEGLSILYDPPQDERLRPLWRGPYLDEQVPLDPWNNPYQYSLDGPERQPFALYSFGADGKPGGEGINADIGYVPE